MRCVCMESSPDVEFEHLFASFPESFFLPSLVPSFGGSRPSMWPCNSKSQPKRFVTFFRPSGGWVGGHLFGGVVRDTFTTREREFVVRPIPFGVVITLGPPTESISKLGFLCTFSIFGVSFLLKKKRKEKKSDWLINYS